MAAFLAKRIAGGHMSFVDVPGSLKEAVRARLEADGLGELAG